MPIKDIQWTLMYDPCYSWLTSVEDSPWPLIIHWSEIRGMWNILKGCASHDWIAHKCHWQFDMGGISHAHWTLLISIKKMNAGQQYLICIECSWGVWFAHTWNRFELSLSVDTPWIYLRCVCYWRKLNVLDMHLLLDALQTHLKCICYWMQVEYIQQVSRWCNQWVTSHRIKHEAITGKNMWLIK
jgi:hypothetical protein